MSRKKSQERKQLFGTIKSIFDIPSNHSFGRVISHREMREESEAAARCCFSEQLFLKIS